MIWDKPSAGEIKINVDAGYCLDTKKSTTGVVARDHTGTIILAASLVGERCTSAEETEANAIWEGLKIAIDNNLNPTILESDCSAAISTANNTSENSSSFWHVYKNISLPRNALPGCIFRKIDRCCNTVAHEHAR
jgi:ribonuclease HI